MSEPETAVGSPGEGEAPELPEPPSGDATAVGERLRATAEREAAEAELELIPEEPAQDPTTQTCATCRGWGIVKTGSAVKEHLTRECPHCRGMGYTSIDGAPAPFTEPAPFWGEPAATPTPAY